MKNAIIIRAVFVCERTKKVRSLRCYTVKQYIQMQVANWLPVSSTLLIPEDVAYAPFKASI